MLIPHKGHTDTIQVYSVTVMTHVKALQAGHSSQGTSEPITPVLVVSVALSEMVSPGVGRTLPEHLVAGSHPSLGGEGRTTLQNILHQYAHVFPAPGEPVTGRTKTVQHEIETNDARPFRCGPRRLAPAGLRTEQT